jgi:hypothetical protein
MKVDAVVTQNILLPQTALELPPIMASAGSKCSKGAGDAAAVSMIWEDVRKALSIGAWTSQSQKQYYRIESKRQTFAVLNKYRPLSSKIDTTAGSNAGGAFKSFSQDSLLEKGFIQMNDRGEPVFFGPDAELILSDAFQQTHCLHAVNDPKQPGLVGVAFEPNRTSKNTDIVGTVWIDRNTRELRRLEFGYDKVPEPADRKTASGEMGFVRLPTGMWIISDWTLTAPIIFTDRRQPGKGTVRAVLKVSHRVLEAYVNNKLAYKAPES